MTIQIRRESDQRVIAAMDLLLFPNDTLSNKHLGEGLWWTARDEHDNPVAYAGLYYREDQKRWWLIRVGVLETHRGHGLQRRLIRVRLAAAKRRGAKRVHTYVAANNIPSHRSVIRCGLLPVANIAGKGFTTYAIDLEAA